METFRSINRNTRIVEWEPGRFTLHWEREPPCFPVPESQGALHNATPEDVRGTTRSTHAEAAHDRRKTGPHRRGHPEGRSHADRSRGDRSEEHTSELQSRQY